MPADEPKTTGGVPAPDELAAALARERYLADDGLLTATHLSLVLDRPLLVEGEPGVGKSELAHALARATGRRLIRLQCYEGLDAAQALYEWDYPKQLLHARVGETGDLYGDEYLLQRPLLDAVRSGETTVLLIDEVDRADSEFEAFLLEFLGDFQITIPERGTFRAPGSPVVVITSNRTRELHDALKRRCLYHWIAFPDAEREREIIRAHAPQLRDQAAAAIIDAVSTMRSLSLVKRPGTAETIDWARGSQVLADEGADWPEAMRRSLGLLLKEHADLATVAAHIPALGTEPGAA